MDVRKYVLIIYYIPNHVIIHHDYTLITLILNTICVFQGSSLTEGNRGKRSKRSGPGSGGANGNHDGHDAEAKNVRISFHLILLKTKLCVWH